MELRQVPFRPIDIGKLCFLRLDDVPHVPQSRLRGAGVIRPGTLDDLDALVQFRDRRSVFVERFTAGDQCGVAEFDGRILGYEWFCDRPVHREEAWGYQIVIPDGFVYAYDAYIDPAYRNTGVWLKFKAYLGDLIGGVRKTGRVDLRGLREPGIPCHAPAVWIQTGRECASNEGARVEGEPEPGRAEVTRRGLLTLQTVTSPETVIPSAWTDIECAEDARDGRSL
jgi:GNAT superfamily N-acetyltransferase